jgi:hypothetical protein
MNTQPIDSSLVQIDAPVSVKSEIDGLSYPIDKFNQAYRLFMMEGREPSKIAADVGLPEIVVLEWSKRNQWAERRVGLLNEAIRVAEAKSRLLQVSKRSATIERHVELARKAVTKAAEVIEKTSSPRDLKSATDAFKAAADVEARAVAVSDQVVERVRDEGTPQRQPAFYIGVGAQSVTVKTVPEPKDITADVKVEERSSDAESERPVPVRVP